MSGPARGPGRGPARGPASGPASRPTSSGRWLALAVVAAAGTAHAQAERTDKPIELRVARLTIDDSVLGAGERAQLAIPVFVAPPPAPPRPATPPRPPTAGDPAAQPKPPPRPEQLEARVGFAAFGAAPLATSSFAPALVRAADQRHWQLALEFAAATVARPGSYRVDVDLVVAGSDEVVQTLAITLDRPGAELRVVPPAIVIDELQLLPGDVVELSRPVWVTLEETSRLARAAFTVADGQVAESDGERIAAGMTLGRATGVVAAGAAERLAVAVTGRFPPGKTIGALEVRSEQANRVEVKYELRTRLRAPAIIGFLVAGWAIGFVLRKVLDWYVQRQRALGQIAEIELEADALRKAIADPRLGAAEVIDACVTARKHWRMADVELPKLRARLDDVKARFQVALDAVRVRAAAFAKAVVPDWRLPADVAGAVAPLRTSAAEAHAELAVNNASGAIAVIEKALDDKVAVLCKRVEDWRTTSLAMAAELAATPAIAGWPAAVRLIANESANKWHALVMAVPTEKPADSPGVEALLRAVHAVEVHLAAAAIQLITNWRLVIEATAAELAELPGKPLAGLAARLPDPGNGGEFALARLTSLARQICDECRSKLYDLVRPEHPSRKQLETWLTDGMWVNAAGLARRVVQSAKDGATLGPAPPRPEPHGTRAAAMVAIDPVALPPQPVEPVAAAARRRARRLELAALTTTSVISAALLLVFYAIHFSNQRAATWLDLAGVAVQAGSIDIGIAAAATAAKNLFRA